MDTGGRTIYPAAGSAQAGLADLARDRRLREARELLETVAGGGQGSRPVMSSDSVGVTLQSFHDQIMASTDLIKATLQVVRKLQEDMGDMRSWKEDFSAKMDNILAMQHNTHSLALENRVHRISKRLQDGSWMCQPRFPKTVRRFLDLNGEFSQIV
jgi:hypothetical protein